MNVSCCSLSSQVLSQNARDRLKFTLVCKHAWATSEVKGLAAWCTPWFLIYSMPRRIVFTFLFWVQEGNKRRKTEATDANAASSRSHAILEVTVCRSDKNHYRKQVQLLCCFQAAHCLEAKVMTTCITTAATWYRSSILCCREIHLLLQ